MHVHLFMDLNSIALFWQTHRTYKAWNPKDMAIELSVSERTPTSIYHMHVLSLWIYTQSHNFQPTYRNNKALNSKRKGYQVISICKNSHQISTICRSISLWIYTQLHNFQPTYRTYKALNSNRHGNQVISLCKITQQIFTICMSICLWIILNRTTFEHPIVTI